MRDPREGITSKGMIETGARRDRVPAHFEPVLAAVVSAVRTISEEASVYLYGSVATGVAETGASDVDILVVGLPTMRARAIASELSAQFSTVCRAVEIAVARQVDFDGTSDGAYGGRVFLRHYCVHLSGPDIHSTLPEFPADRHAARGFNGDIARHARRWRRDVDSGVDPSGVGRRLARKSLLAVAGLVSVHDDTWTTDRTSAASRWAEIEPRLSTDLWALDAWARGSESPDKLAVESALDGIVAEIVVSFEASIGLWGSADGS